MSANLPFVRGQNVVLRYYQDGKSVTLAATNWTCEANMTETADGVNGEHRDRLDAVLNYYSVTVDVNQTDESVVQAIMDDQANEDAENLPLNRVAGVQVRHRDGTRAAYVLRGVTQLGWNTAMTGRADPYKLSLKFRFTDWSPAPTF